MASESNIFSLRPRKANQSDFDDIEEWCIENNRSISDVFNSYIPAIAYALKNNARLGADGKIYVQSDFRDVPLLDRNGE